MGEEADLSRYLEIWLNSDCDREQHICEREILHRCRVGCARASVQPCIAACFRVVANPAAANISLPHLLKNLRKQRYYLSNDNSFGLEILKPLGCVSVECVNKCLPRWARQWKVFCCKIFKHVCVRTCKAMCEQCCRVSCKLPCARTPLRQLYKRGKKHEDVGMAFAYCMGACALACLRTSKYLMSMLLSLKGKHVCGAQVADTEIDTQESDVDRIKNEILEERRAMTNKGNVRNSCKF